jgi:hypothetical protein
LIREFVWDPIAEIGAPVFAFGAPWFAMLQDGLGLEVIERLGAGGRDYGSAVPSRAITVFESPVGLPVVAEKHGGSAGPPNVDRPAGCGMRSTISPAAPGTELHAQSLRVVVGPTPSSRAAAVRRRNTAFVSGWRR